jgi:hypothetical protein
VLRDILFHLVPGLDVSAFRVEYMSAGTPCHFSVSIRGNVDGRNTGKRNLGIIV